LPCNQPISSFSAFGTGIALEQKGLVWLNRTKKGISLAKASYDGLKKANPPEHYQWYPGWIDKGRDRVF
jgi:hypothetical protein